MLGMEIPIFDIGREEDSEMSGELILQMTLVLLKYGREKELAEKLRLVLQSISEQLEGYRVGMLVDTIRKYVMSVNPEVGQKELQSIFDDFWPVQHEPGSVADQLISKGREEGRQEGEIKLIRILESILGIESGATDLSKKSLEELRCITESLQAQVKKRGN